MRILVADDEKNIRESIIKLLKLESHDPKGAENGVAAKRLLETEVYDLLLLDIKMPGLSGLELLDWITSQGPNIPVIMISAHGDVNDAVRALKTGAADYLTKPFDPEELVLRIAKISQSREVIGKPFPQQLSSGSSRLEEILAKVAKAPSTVLITGESGTGKEVTARRIHTLSPRSRGPFMAVNIGGVPENLLESELFGYEKGAFTGAQSRKIGLLEMARGGTLFLDEIGEIPGNLQVKILRVLQDKQIRRLGGTTDIPVEARIICATNKDLEQEIKKGHFREDLFYRINVFPVHLPPLRERKKDIPHLVELLVVKLQKTWNGPFPKMSQGALDALANYHFPGNIRELENILERAAILSSGPLIQASDLDFLRIPGKDQPQDAYKSSNLSLKELERRAIHETLMRWEGNQTKAAKELGITRRTLFNKMKEYGIHF